MSTGAQAAAQAPERGPTPKLEQKFYLVPIDALAPSASNPRKRIRPDELRELAESIARSGVLQPLTVRPLTENAYEIVIGERRWRAAKLANLAHVPCLVRMMTDAAALEAQIVENLQRRDIAPLEEAASYQALLKATNDSATVKMGVADIAARIGKSPRYVYDRLELLKLTPFAREALQDAKISAGHAAEIARLDPKRQEDVVRVAARAELSVMALREYIREAKDETSDETAALKSARHAENGRAGAEVRRASRTSASPRAIATAASLDASYSGESMERGKIRPPFAIGEELWCCVGSMSQGNRVFDLEAYRVVPRSEFSGRTTDYNGKILKGEKSRRDPKGFFHGVSVSCGGQKFVLCGPPRSFPRDPAEMPAAGKRRNDSRACSTLAAAAKPGEFSAAEIQRAVKRSLHDVRFQFGLAPQQLRLEKPPARKRGEWLAVIVQSGGVRTSAKPRRPAHGKRRSR